jgi:hypothetical protein
VSVRIWVNRSWATTVHSLRLIRSNPDAEPVFLLGTHADPDSPVLTECDERAPELEAEGDAYVDAALELCARQRIDVFVPRWEGLAVARRVEEFRALGTEVTGRSGRDVAGQASDLSHEPAGRVPGATVAGGALRR